MASWADLKELRLKTCDPDGYIDLDTVANVAALPVAPKGQTAYRKEDSGDYVAYDAELLAWGPVKLEVSDARAMAMVDAYGSASRAAPYMVRQIMAGLGAKMRIARSQGGAGSTDFVNLTTLYNFYKGIIETFEVEAAVEEGASEGRYLRTKRPSIGGGMIG
jgi:hypothetical protein